MNLAVIAREAAEGSECLVCGAAIVQSGRARPRRTCSGRCRKRLQRIPVSPPEPPAGAMRRTTAALTEAIRRRGPLDETASALLTALALVADGLDAAPANAALWAQWRGLLRDLRAGGAGPNVDQVELAEAMAVVMAPQ